MKCRKCGGEGVGPRWNKLTDRLDYQCAQCGFQLDDACLDAKKTGEIPYIVNVINPQGLVSDAATFIPHEEPFWAWYGGVR